MKIAPNKSRIDVSIGVCAFNEEKNIGTLLQALIDQSMRQVNIAEIIIVSSGSTDKTNEIVSFFAKKDTRLRHIIQERREGKASAINLFLKDARQEVLVLESADTIPSINTIENLVLPFLDPKVGMTGGHSIPINDRNTFVGFSVQIQWDLLHRISQESPRFGELIAFRRLLNDMPENVNTDEAYIEYVVREAGLEMKYVPEAAVYNRGPENIIEFINQRRRIYAGHLHLKSSTGYEVSSLRLRNVAAKAKELDLSLKELFFCVGAAVLEVLSRALGAYDFYIHGKNHYLWKTANSTKDLKD